MSLAAQYIFAACVTLTAVVRREDEIAKMRRVCRLGREVLDLAALAVRPGVRCSEIDTIVHEACMKRKCYPSPLNYRNFPKVCSPTMCHACASQRLAETHACVAL
jgi:methionyl aminopeptidase